MWRLWWKEEAALEEGGRSREDRPLGEGGRGAVERGVEEIDAERREPHSHRAHPVGGSSLKKALKDRLQQPCRPNRAENEGLAGTPCDPEMALEAEAVSGQVGCVSWGGVVRTVCYNQYLL